MPVNRAATRATGLVRTITPCPFGQEILVVTPSMLASCDIKLTQIDQHRQSRTGLSRSLTDCSASNQGTGQSKLPGILAGAGT